MEKYSQNNNPKETVETSIDLSKIFKILLRNKRVISYFIFGSFIASAFYSLTLKKIWQGELQIVLEESKNENSMSQALSSITRINLPQLNNKSSLKTEVGILESPSVLMSVFEFVRENKGMNKRKEKLTFANWKKNSLDIQLKKNTSILNLSYRDSDKGVIIPVLNKISKKYQNYSGEKRARDLELGVEYFQNQISQYKSKADTSMREAQEYSLDHDMVILIGNSETKKVSPNSIDIEQMRVSAANELRNINYRLEQLSNSDLDSKSLVSLGKSIPDLVLNTYPQDLFNVESELIIAKTLYKENDIEILELQNRQKILLDILKAQIKTYLEAQKINAKAQLKAAERPKEVILRYGQLITKAIKDKATLDNLENNYRLVQLEKARRRDPWKLIAEPTLLPEPVKPNKLEIIGIGTLLGFIAGSIFSLYQNKKNNIIFETSDLNQYFIEESIIKEICIDDSKKTSETLKYISKKYLYETKDKFDILFLGDKENKYKEKLKKVINSNPFFKKKNLEDNLNQINDSCGIILIVALGITNGYQLKNNLDIINLRNQEIIFILSIADLTKNYA